MIPRWLSVTAIAVAAVLLILAPSRRSPRTEAHEACRRGEISRQKWADLDIWDEIASGPAD